MSSLVHPHDWRDSGISWRLRASVRLQRFGLDRRLAARSGPNRSPELELRARQLTRDRERLALADRLESVLREAERTDFGMTARVLVQRGAIRAARPQLTALIDDLRAIQDPAPAGVARASLLVTDGASPLYAPSAPGTVAEEATLAALDLER